MNVSRILALFRREVEDETTEREVVHPSVIMSVDSPMTGTVLTRGPRFDLFASPSLRDGGTASPTRVTIEVCATDRGAPEPHYNYVAVCMLPHVSFGDGPWYGPARELYQEAVNDVDGHEHPDQAAVHALLDNGVSIGPLAS